MIVLFGESETNLKKGVLSVIKKGINAHEYNLSITAKLDTSGYLHQSLARDLQSLQHLQKAIETGQSTVSEI